MTLLSYLNRFFAGPLASMTAIVNKFQAVKPDNRKENDILVGYRELIQNIKTKGKPEKEIIGSRSLLIKIRNNSDLHSFALTLVDGRLSVVWKLESASHGRRGKEWSFDSKYDQKKMFDEMEDDLKLYQKALLREIY